jgi:cephalosporin-C deacetylase-like acetyl esterase
MSRTLKLLVVALLCGAFVPSLALAQQIRIAPSHANGVYAATEPIVWNVSVTGDNASQVRSAHYVVKKGGGDVIAQGDIDLSSGSAQVTTSQTAPLAYLLVVTAPSPLAGQPKPLAANGGAVVAPERIQPSMPRPADFDAFWAKQLADLAAVPASPVIEKSDSGRAGVDYETVTMDNVGGAKIHLQLARPARDGQFPAIVILQYAGVYGLKKESVTGPAAQGWLAIDVMAHDLPLNQPDSFYATAAASTLKDYATIGNADRDTSYFLKMLLGCVRAAQYVTTRPDWNGKTLVAAGTSQGGFQAVALTALMPRITAVMALVPACCDQTADVAGRAVPWPYWIKVATAQNRDALRQASRYYDTVNFASMVHVPALIGIGLVDQTSVPSGDFAMVNQLAGAKEAVILPFSDHHGTNNTQAAYQARAAQWRAAILAGQNPKL